MSLPMVNAVLKHSKATGTDRLILMILAHHVNDESDTCFPSRETICSEAGIKERNLIYCLKRLESLEEVEIMRGRGRGNLTEYRVKLQQEKVQAPASISDEKGAIEKVQSTVKRCNPASQKVQSSVTKGAIDTRAYKDIELKGTEKEPCEPPSPDFFEEIKSLIIAATGEPPVNGNLLRIEQAAVKITQSAGQTALPDLKSFIADQGSKIIKLAFIAGDFCSWNAARKRKAEPEKPKREYTGLTWATMTEEQRASFRN